MKLLYITLSFLLQCIAPLHAIMNDYIQIRPRIDNAHNIVIDDSLMACIAAMVHDAAQDNIYDKLPESIKRCYMHIDKGLLGLPVEDVIEALPNILQYAVEQHKKRLPGGTNLLTHSIVPNIDYGNFSITQNPTEKVNNHPISQPITQPGIYCLAENVIGSLIIDSSQVAIIFKDHTLTATGSGGIISSGNSHIRIEGGTITGNSGEAIAINNGNDIQISNMHFDSNNRGITCDNVKNFLINNSQFSNYSDSSINLANSSNGKISNCQLHNNNTSQLLTSLAIIILNNCKQLTCDNIIMTENTNVKSLKGINAHATHESRFENIQFTANEASQTLQGVILENCDDTLLKKCIVNKNNLLSNNIAILTGIVIHASIDGGSKNNSIIDCQIHDNNCSSRGSDSSAIFVGIDIAGALNGGIVGNHACSHTTIKNCSIVNNNLFSQEANSTFAGINMSGILGGGSIGNNACANCSLDTTTINNNNCTSHGDYAVFIGANLSSTIDTATIGNNGCANCSITKTSLHNNNCNSTGAAFFVGLNLAGTMGGNLGNSVCAGCSINKFTANNNNCLSDTTSWFVGLNLCGVIAGGSAAGNNCNDCILQAISICGNTLTNTSASGFMRGIIMNGNPGSIDGGCNNVTCIKTFLKGNSVTTNGTFVGFLIDGTSAISLAGGCNNVSLTTCKVDQNFGFENSAAYQILGADNGGIGGARNTQLEHCIARQNSADEGTFNGFDISDVDNIILKNCISSANNSLGFKITNVTNSCLHECEALNNSSDGFRLLSTTKQVALTNNKSLGNMGNGIFLSSPAAGCLTKSNIVIGNNLIGIYDEALETTGNKFYNNKAYNNTLSNYTGIAPMPLPSPHAAFYTNISNESQDCNTCKS